MGTTYRSINWEFNGELFAQKLQAMSEDDITAAAELMGVTRTAFYRWARNKYDNEFPFPRMHNFLRLCNLLDLDPRDFFVLEIPKE